MKLTYVDTLPKKKSKQKLQKLIGEFVESNREVVRLDLDGSEYK